MAESRTEEIKTLFASIQSNIAEESTFLAEQAKESYELPADDRSRDPTFRKQSQELEKLTQKASKLGEDMQTLADLEVKMKDTSGGNIAVPEDKDLLSKIRSIRMWDSVSPKIRKLKMNTKNPC